MKKEFEYEKNDEGKQWVAGNFMACWGLLCNYATKTLDSIKKISSSIWNI
jgi:hypothetical protein